MCVCVCASAYEIVLSILFLTSFLMMLAFVTATILWTSSAGGMGCDDAIILFLDHVCTRRPWCKEQGGLPSCGHYLWLPPLSVNVLCPLVHLCETFLMFILVGLVFQLPESLGIIYKFEISLY